jgi:hypothetical protein
MNVTFSLEFDLDNKSDAEFLEWYNKEENKYLLKDSMVLGSFIVRHGLHKIFVNEKKDTLMLKYNTEINSLNDILNHTISNYEERIAHVKSQKDEFYGEQINILKERLNSLREDTTEESKRCREQEREMVAREYNGKIEVFQQQIQQLREEIEQYRQNDFEKVRLKECLKQKDNEISMLKSNNIIKGNIGESLVKNIVGKWFCDIEIVDMSGSGSMSDIHLVNSSDQRIVVECKNKATVALTDIEKSLRDIDSLKESYGDRFVGYIFCSLKSHNIPRKGEFCFEMIGDVPVVWFGVDFDSNADLAEKELVNVVKIMMSMVKHLGGKNGVERDMFLDGLKSVLGNIVEQKKTIGVLQSSLSSMKTHVDKLSLSTNEIFEDLRNMLGDQGDKSTHECRKCKKTFKTIGGYERHIKACVK